jgi:uncharacterized membrane protein
MSPLEPGSLEDQVHELRSRVLALEAALKANDIALRPLQKQEATAIPQTPAPAPHFAQQAQIAAGANVLPVVSSSSKTSNASKERSLESQIGSQWFNRIGILAVLVGMALFLKLAIDNHWVGPLGRVLIGLLAGVGFIAWSVRFQRQDYAAFAYSLKAIGSGILYLSLWAAFSLFHLIPAGAAFAAMILVTAFNGFMAWIEDAELLAVYCIAGGLSTPLLVATGGNHEVSLFSYLLMLNVAVLGMVSLRPWSRLLFGTFTGTVLFVADWWFGYYSPLQFERTLGFVSAFFLIFAFAPRLVRVGSQRDGDSMWDRLALVLMPVANAGLGFLAYYALFERSNMEGAGPWIAVAFATFYLLLLRLPAGGVLRPSPAVLSDIHLASAVVFLALAIPLKAHGRWLTIGWLAEGAALLWVASRASSQLLRGLALLCLGLGLAALLLVNSPASITPLLNARFATYCVAIAVFAGTARLASVASPDDDGQTALRWSAIAAGASLLVNILILVAVSLEIHSYWWFARWPGPSQLMHDYRVYAQFSYSALFMGFGAILLGIGLWRQSAFVRWQALVLVAVAIGKVFLVDVRELSQGYSILSFFGLGALLLGVSFIYQRDWLRLRKLDGPTT